MAAFQRAPGRPECQYGLDCYRRNAEHWQQFDHPAAHKFLAAAPQAPSAKRRGRQDDEEAAAGPKRQHVATASGSAASSSSSTATSASAPASATVITAVLVFAPGAGGSTARAMRELQETELRARGLAVARCDDEPLDTGEKRWVTSAAGHQGNLAHVVAVCRRAAQRYPDAPLVLCGASFGCRVLAETLRTAREELPAACRRDALICCGYPLHAEGKPEGADPKRAAHLLQLPDSLVRPPLRGLDPQRRDGGGSAPIGVPQPGRLSGRPRGQAQGAKGRAARAAG